MRELIKKYGRESLVLLTRWALRGLSIRFMVGRNGEKRFMESVRDSGIAKQAKVGI